MEHPLLLEIFLCLSSEREKRLFLGSTQLVDPHELPYYVLFLSLWFRKVAPRLCFGNPLRVLLVAKFYFLLRSWNLQMQYFFNPSHISSKLKFSCIFYGINNKSNLWGKKYKCIRSNYLVRVRILVKQIFWKWFIRDRLILC
jgi:hypothetical protein